MKVQEVEISKLNPAEYNPRRLTDTQYQHLRNSLEEFGIVDPIVVNSHKDRKNIIIGGHQRARIWKDMGNDTIPVVYLDLTLKRERELNIRLNKNLGEFDQEKLLAEYTKDELIDYGFEEVDFKGEITPEEPDETLGDNVIPDVQEDPITETGDIYQLGPHKLVCGDATLVDHLEKLMGAEKANLIVTDPPYNVNYEGKTKDKLKIKNDAMGNDRFLQFLIDTFTNCSLFAVEGGAAYVFHADSEGLNFRKAFIDGGFELKQCCIWVKNTMVMGRQDYHWQHEPILYGWKKGAAHIWKSDRKQTTIWNFDRPQQSKEHPTMKPLDLVCYPILNSSERDHIVLDVFLRIGIHVDCLRKTGAGVPDNGNRTQIL